MEKTRDERIDDFVKAERKSVFGAFLLALLFGPIGHLYASPIGGVLWIMVAIVLGMMQPGAVVVIWFLCIFTAPVAASDYNKRLRTKAELMAG